MKDSRNWAGLPLELLVSIADRLPVADYARFPAVCSSWASSIRDLPPKPPSSSHFPWHAFIPADPTAPITFLNRPENHRGYRIPSTAAAYLSPFYIGHRDGWLAVVLGDNSVFLLNPLTSASARLPSAIIEFSYYFLDDIKKVVLSASPGGGPPLAVIMCFGFLAFSRPGDSKWTTLSPLHHYYHHVGAVFEVEDPTVEDGLVQDVVCHAGKLFVIFSNGHLLSFDLSGPFPVVSELLTAGMSGWVDCYFEKMFLVSAPSGDLLLVRKRRCSATIFDVMRFDPGLNGWVVVNDLGGRGDWSLFLDPIGSMVLSGMPGLDGNQIFFIDPIDPWMETSFKVGVYDFGKGTTVSFFPEDTCFDKTTYQHLIWFRPSLS